MYYINTFIKHLCVIKKSYKDTNKWWISKNRGDRHWTQHCPARIHMEVFIVIILVLMSATIISHRHDTETSRLVNG